MLISLLLYLAFGALAGILSGLFGIGGGVVIVPFLVWQLGTQGVNPDLLMVMAVATSLATIVITSVSAVYAHHRRGGIDWPVVRQMVPGILLGSVLGSIVAHHLPVQWFKLLFALFLLFVAARMGLGQSQSSTRPWPRSSFLFGPAGLLIGTVSAILGIGGGTLSVPMLVRCQYVMKEAVAISVACGFPIAVAGTLTYGILGWNDPNLPNQSFGYVYLPAFGGIILTSVLFAPLGAKLAHSLPTAKLKRYFSLVLAAIGLKMLTQAIAGLI